MFFELKNGILVNLNQAWKISNHGSMVMAEYDNDTYEVLYEGSPSECKTFWDNLRRSLDLVSFRKGSVKMEK